MPEIRTEDSPAVLGPATGKLVVAASLVVIFAGIKAAERLIVPFLLAVFISIIVSSVMLWLRRRGVGKPAALALMGLALLAIGVGLANLFGAAFEGFRASMPEYLRLLDSQVQNLTQWLEARGVEVPEQFVQEYANPQALMRFTGRFLGGLSGMLGNTFLILVTVIFMLLEASSFTAKLEALPEGLRRSVEPYHEVVAAIRRYMALKTVICIITGLLATGLLLALRVENALLWGLVAFLLNYIPNIGSFIAAVPPLLLALILNGPWTALGVAVGYTVINVSMGNLLEPRLMGHGMGLSTLVVFMSLVFWGWLLGPVGMLLSVPLTMSVKIALAAGESTRPVAMLLGASAHPPPRPAE